MRTQRNYGLGAVFDVALRNWDTLFIFEIVYRLFGFIVWLPLQRYLLSLLPALVGETYLGQDNFALVFRYPAAIILLVSVLMMTGLFIFYEIITLFIYCEKGWKRERVKIIVLLKETAGKAAGLFVPKRLPVFLLLPAVMFSAFSFISGYMGGISVPEFILEYIFQDKLLLPLFIGGTIFLHFVLFRYLFCLPEFLLEGGSFGKAWRQSLALLKKNRFSPLWKTIFYFLIFSLSAFVAAAGGILLLAAGIRGAAGIEAGRGVFRLYFTSLRGVWSIVIGALASVFLCACIVVLYHRAGGSLRPEKTKRRWNIGRSLLRAASSFGILVILIFFSESEIGGNIPGWGSNQIQVIAHRAGAAFAPENTEAALKCAIQDQASVAEIDVQQLKDGTLVVMHDTNFKRTTGKNLDVWDADYAVIRDLDAGGHISADYRGEPVPTLESMLLAAKGHIRLMIELKSTGREQGLEEQTLSLINKYGMQDQCMIASMDMEILKRVKSLEPDMQTVYISVLLLTQGQALKEIDAYSVETTSLSAELVYQAHLQGKQVYAWTAYSERSINKILRCHTDGLVTDNVLLAQYYIEEKQADLFLREFTNWFFGPLSGE